MEAWIIAKGCLGDTNPVMWLDLDQESEPFAAVTLKPKPVSPSLITLLACYLPGERGRQNQQTA